MPPIWRVFAEIQAFFRPQSHRNQSLMLAQRRPSHRERFARLMGLIAAASPASLPRTNFL
jgi:hypothetical protein